MSIKNISIGGFGPFPYDDTLPYDPEGEHDPDYPTSGETRNLAALRMSGNAILDDTPVQEYHVAKLGDIDVAIQSIEVVDITDPTPELEQLTGESGSIVVAYQAPASSDLITLYSWATNNSRSLTTPFVIPDIGATGFWIAVGGKFSVNGVQYPPNTNMYLNSDSYLVYDAPYIKLFVNGAEEQRWG